MASSHVVTTSASSPATRQRIAEVSSLRNAGRHHDRRRLTLVSTLSPCPLCPGTAILFKIPKVIIGENRTSLGAEDWMRACGIEILDLDDPRCIRWMDRLRSEKPEKWAEDVAE